MTKLDEWKTRTQQIARSKRLARDICKILDVRPTRGRYQEVIDAIHAELTPDPQGAMQIIKELPELLADFEHCALDADGRLDSVRAKTISKIRRQVQAVLTKGQ
jgi:hypothetical protein